MIVDINILNRIFTALLIFFLHLHISYAQANFSSQILNEEERSQSHTPAARLASGVKLGVQAWNDFKNLTQAQSTLMFLAERYGNVGVEFGRSKYTHDETTTQSPLFDVGVADFGDMTEVRLLDGTVLLAQDQVILPQHLILGNATDTRQERFKSTSTRLGLNVFTGMPSVSHNQNKSQSTQQTHRNAVVHIYGPGGVLDATQSQSLTLDGGRITAPRAQGRVDQVTVTSPQDQASSSQSGFGFGISGTLATGPRGSVTVARGRSYEQSVHDEAGLQIQDPTGFSIGTLTVTGPTLDKNLASLANHVTFHPLKDKKGGWSFQGNLCNLDLSSPQNFMQSLQQGVQQAVRAALAAEITHQAGGTGLLPSAAGIIAGLDLTNDGTTQDVNITGGFSFRDGKRQFEVPFVNVNPGKPADDTPQKVEEKEDTQDTQPKTQPSAIPHDTENEPYDRADEDESQYDDIFKSPTSRDHDRDDTDPFRAYFYDNLRQSPTQQPQSVYNLLANIDNTPALEDADNLFAGRAYNQDLSQLQNADHDLKRNYFTHSFFNQSFGEPNPLKVAFQEKIDQLEREKRQPLSQVDKDYLRACGLRDFINDFAAKAGSEHFLALRTGGPLGYLIYLASDSTDHQTQDAAVTDLAHQLNLSRAGVQEAILMATTAKDAVLDKKKLPQDIYQIFQALKNRQASSSRPANNNRVPANDDRNLMVQPSQAQRPFAVGERNIAPPQGSDLYGFLASRNPGQNKVQPSQPSATQGAATSTNNAQQSQISGQPRPSEPRAPFIAVDPVKTAEIEKIRQQFFENRFLNIENAKKLGFRGNNIKGVVEFNPKNKFIEANTELVGTQQDAYRMFINLRREMSANPNSSKATIERFLTKDGTGERLKVTYDDGTYFQLRPEGKSGHVKIEINDVIKEIREKITFKTGEN